MTLGYKMTVASILDWLSYSVSFPASLSLSLIPGKGQSAATMETQAAYGETHMARN